MDFFDRQERARRTSRFLVVAFALSFAAVALATTALVAFVVRLGEHGIPARQSFGEWAAAHPGLLGSVALGTLALMMLASLYRAATLSGGGGEVARMLGGTEVASDTTDLARRRLLNVVEEMAIASGLPMPDVYVLERERGINAFAAGLTPADAAIAVTRGALEQLDRAELQGVIGHEISHIANGDMRLNQRLIGFSFGILALSQIGRLMMRAARSGRGRRSDGVPAVIAIGLAIFVIGSIGLLLSRLIKAAVSRERERLADASAVQFTRDPSGLASALKKIAGVGARLTAVDSEEVAHMLFEHRARGLGRWLATHPPLVERIRALEPGFDLKTLGRLPAASAIPDASGSLGAETAPAADASAAFAAPFRDTVALDTADGSPLEHAGEIGSPGLGAALREALPADVYDAAHSRDTSLLLVLALALSADARVLAAQRALLDAQLGPRRAARCETLKSALERLDPALRLPLLELALPALRQRPAGELEYLFELAGKLAACNTAPRLFDHLLLRMLAAQLADLPGRPAALAAAPKLSPRAACAALLAVVAAYGHDDADDAVAAYRAGEARIGRLPALPSGGLDTMRDPTRLDAPLARLARLGPRDKRKVLNAVLATIRHDKRIGLEEIELLRTIAAALGCPLPWGAGLVRPIPAAAPATTAPDVRARQGAASALDARSRNADAAAKNAPHPAAEPQS